LTIKIFKDIKEAEEYIDEKKLTRNEFGRSSGEEACSHLTNPPINRPDELIAKILQKLNAQTISRLKIKEPCECPTNIERGGEEYEKKNVGKGECLRKT
jgi:hypothetical protein